MSDNFSSSVAGSGMDQKIEASSWTTGRLLAFGGAAMVIALAVYGIWFMDTRSTLNVNPERLTIATVEEDLFQEFIQVTGMLQPSRSIYLDAVEGGVIEKVYRTSGTTLSQGDSILKLSNSDLSLQVLQQSSSIYDQINQTRNSRLNIEQNSLNLKERLANAENQYEITNASYQRNDKLYSQELVSEKAYIESRENYEYQKQRYDLIYESFKQDSIKSNQQLEQIDQSLGRMQRSLGAVQNILDRLLVTAPISGQLSTIDLTIGQSISAGERIGQIDVLDQYKVRVNIDEYNLSRITTGLRGTVNISGKEHTLEISKVYPVVENGQFQVDMSFVDSSPTELTRGQTLRIRLELGDSSRALLLKRGGFYQETGGSWVYKLSPDGKRAIKKQIQLGRQNPNNFEVLSGLNAGDRVVISGYEAFGDNEVLELQ